MDKWVEIRDVFGDGLNIRTHGPGDYTLFFVNASGDGSMILNDRNRQAFLEAIGAKDAD